MTAELQTPTPHPVRLRRRRRRPVRRTLVVTHRWLSLVLGLVLVVLTTTGSILLYRGEITRLVDHDAYAASGGPRTVTWQQAFDTVTRAHPDFEPVSVVAEHGVLRVTDYTESWTVDPATGRILGEVHTPSVLGLLDNLHECALSCEETPGYVAFLTKTVPGTDWLGYDAAITWGGLVPGLLGLMLLFLALSGLWLWWPRLSRLKESMSVRWRRGRFARDTDLHKVAGMIALPLLLVWAVTGAGFEMQPVRDAWTALTPGSYEEAPAFTSKKGSGPDIGLDAAAAAASRFAGGAAVLSVDPPAKDDATAIYSAYVDQGYDTYNQGDYPGIVGVGVDRRTGEAAYVYSPPSGSTSQRLWDRWSYPVHAGSFINGWWKLIWFVLGMAPLLLAVTGVSTWLVRRRSAVARRRARRLTAAA